MGGANAAAGWSGAPAPAATQPVVITASDTIVPAGIVGVSTSPAASQTVKFVPGAALSNTRSLLFGYAKSVEKKGAVSTRNTSAGNAAARYVDETVSSKTIGADAAPSPSVATNVRLYDPRRTTPSCAAAARSHVAPLSGLETEKSAAPAPAIETLTLPAAPTSASYAASVTGAPFAPSKTRPFASADAYTKTPTPAGEATITSAAPASGAASVGGVFAMYQDVAAPLASGSKRGGASAASDAVTAGAHPSVRTLAENAHAHFVDASPWTSVAGVAAGDRHMAVPPSVDAAAVQTSSQPPGVGVMRAHVSVVLVADSHMASADTGAPASALSETSMYLVIAPVAVSVFGSP